MTISILLDDCALPDKGAVEISVNRAFDINFSADEARLKVNAWLLDEVSYMMGAGEPLLTIGAEVVWRVPVLLTASHIGQVGTVGVLEVDVQTGEIAVSPECKAEIMQRAEELAKSMPPYMPRPQMPAHYLADEMQTDDAQPDRIADRS